MKPKCDAQPIIVLLEAVTAFMQVLFTVTRTGPELTDLMDSL